MPRVRIEKALKVELKEARVRARGFLWWLFLVAYCAMFHDKEDADHESAPVEFANFRVRCDRFGVRYVL
jgi:hypothetical protein